MKPAGGNQRGFVLVVVLGLLAVLFILALSLGAAVRADLARARRFQDAVAAEFLAKAGMAWAVHYLQALERAGRLWQAPWRFEPARFGDQPLGAGTFSLTYVDATGQARFGLQDEEARLNVNTAPRALLEALLQPAAVDVERLLQQRPFATPEDLLVRGGLEPAVFYGQAGRPGLEAFLTVWGSGKLNVNTAPWQVLALLPGMTPAQAQALVAYRHGADGQPGTADDRFFPTLAALRQVVPLDPAWEGLLTVAPTAFRTVVSGQVGTPPHVQRHRRLVVIDLAGQVRYWRPLPQ
ncbi:MAG: hypothetical protein KatS3mg131_2451 [Candidatus Tectimicrobiota bacterium]|nr:MAG: hypothetical protein KatS3mg131_2451 [Candidatus Tectomicrobia bacterium]